MADEDQTDEIDNEDEDGKPVGGKKKLIIIVGAVLLLAGGGAGAFFGGLIGGGSPEEKAVKEAKVDEKKDKKGTKDGEEGAVSSLPTYYELPEFIVNLNSGGKRTSFLKMKVTLELNGSGPEVVQKMDAYRPRVEDAFNTYLRELRTSDLSGSAGIYRLREELMMRMSKTIDPDLVKDILFNEIIVQ